jgi:hypothetical protein
MIGAYGDKAVSGIQFTKDITSMYQLAVSVAAPTMEL